MAGWYQQVNNAYERAHHTHVLPPPNRAGKHAAPTRPHRSLHLATNSTQRAHRYHHGVPCHPASTLCFQNNSPYRGDSKLLTSHTYDLFYYYMHASSNRVCGADRPCRCANRWEKTQPESVLPQPLSSSPGFCKSREPGLGGKHAHIDCRRETISVPVAITAPLGWTVAGNGELK